MTYQPSTETPFPDPFDAIADRPNWGGNVGLIEVGVANDGAWGFSRGNGVTPLTVSSAVTASNQSSTAGPGRLWRTNTINGDQRGFVGNALGPYAIWSARPQADWHFILTDLGAINQRLLIGLGDFTSLASGLGGDTPTAAAFVALQFSSPRGDTTFHVIRRAALAAVTDVNTGVAPIWNVGAAARAFSFGFRRTAVGLDVYLRDFQGNTIYSDSYVANLPGAANLALPIAGIEKTGSLIAQEFRTMRYSQRLRGTL